MSCVLLCLALPLALAASPVPTGKPASYPSWWFERDVIQRINPSVTTPAWHGDYPSSDDFAAVNQGQLKGIVTQASAELDAHLPGGAGTDIHDLVLSWQNPAAPGVVRDDFAVVNQGQLKTVAKLFYARLIAEGYTATYPWSTATTDDDNYAAVNIGQIKYLFRFDLTTDTDSDGLPDWWEQRIVDADPGDAITSIDDVLPEDDFDYDGQSNELEQTQGTDPTKPNGPDTDGDGMVDATEPHRGKVVGIKDHPAVKLQF